jgi:MFS family permease
LVRGETEEDKRVVNWRLWMPPALEKPRVRLYAAGHIVSVFGNWLQQIALAWLVYRLTGDVFLLGLTGFLLNISYLLFGGVAGVLVDRLPRMQFLIAIDVASATLAVVLAVMVFSGVTAITPYLVVAAMIGIASGFEMPVRQSLFKDIVEDKALLPSAIALSALVYNTGRMLGPAIAGVLLLYVSEGWCFLLNALSYVAIIAALFAMKLPAAARRAAPPRAHQSLRESWHVLAAFPGVRYLLPTAAALGLFVTPYASLMPSIAAEFFDGKPSTVGLLMGAAGVGAFASALYLSLQPGYQRQLRLASVAPFITGAAVIAFALSRSLLASVLLLAMLGASMMLSTNSINALLQQSTPDEWRGRVIGLYAMAFAGTAPIGALLGGALAAQIGLTATLALGGALTVLAGALSRWRLHTHPEAMRTLVRALRS